MYYFDPTYILVIIGGVICLIASGYLNSVYNKYAKVWCSTGLTGVQAAERILNCAGIYDVRIEHINGNMTDHYDPTYKVLRLSDSTFHSSSIAAIGIAAHECGHAIQHKEGYAPLKLRKLLVPAAQIGSNLGLPIVIFSIIFGLSQTFVYVGIFIFAFAVLFQIITLPVEYNASNRAITLIERYGLVGFNEVKGCRKVLNAAALTYVAAAASSVLQLLRLIGLSNRRND